MLCLPVTKTGIEARHNHGVSDMLIQQRIQVPGQTASGPSPPMVSEPVHNLVTSN